MSSRSHCILVAYLEVSCPLNTYFAQVNFVDLAGSERFEQIDGKRSAINPSLSFLGEVVKKICDKDKCVNFRNSILN